MFEKKATANDLAQVTRSLKARIDSLEYENAHTIKMFKAVMEYLDVQLDYKYVKSSELYTFVPNKKKGKR